ncbi:MAG: hypothetical protein ACFB4I_14040 [Cyanophyceae cyanobacterium]
MHHSPEADSFVVFPVAKFLLALPIHAVVKVVNYPLVNNESAATGFIYLSEQPIPLLNLHEQLPTSAALVAKAAGTDVAAPMPPNLDGGEVTAAPLLVRQTPSVPPFLVIAYCQEELYAIPVDEPPNLLKIPHNSIRNLPKTFKRQGLLALVDEMAVLTERGKTLTVFLLDLHQLGITD